MRGLDRGEQFIVTRNSVPVGELVPNRRPEFVARDVVLTAFAGLPRLDGEQFRKDVDQFVDQDPTPRA